jgi:hypothetical protein
VRPVLWGEADGAMVDVAEIVEGCCHEEERGL